MIFKMEKAPCHFCKEPTGFVCGNCEKPTCEWCSHETTKRGRLCDICFTGCSRCGLTDVHIVDCSSEYESLCEECAVIVNGQAAQDYIDHLHAGGTRDNYQEISVQSRPVKTRVKGSFVSQVVCLKDRNIYKDLGAVYDVGGVLFSSIVHRGKQIVIRKETIHSYWEEAPKESYENL